jgi:hypothetical protein
MVPMVVAPSESGLAPHASSDARAFFTRPIVATRGSMALREVEKRDNPAIA